MSDKKPKRGYKVGGKSLAYDLRVRISDELRLALRSYAQAKGETPAAAARQILTDALLSGAETETE